MSRISPPVGGRLRLLAIAARAARRNAGRKRAMPTTPRGRRHRPKLHPPAVALRPRHRVGQRRGVAGDDPPAAGAPAPADNAALRRAARRDGRCGDPRLAAGAATRGAERGAWRTGARAPTGMSNERAYDRRSAGVGGGHDGCATARSALGDRVRARRCGVAGVRATGRRHYHRDRPIADDDRAGGVAERAAPALGPAIPPRSSCIPPRPDQAGCRSG